MGTKHEYKLLSFADDIGILSKDVDKVKLKIKN